MSNWQLGDGFSAASPQSRDLAQSWSNQEEESRTSQNECWGPQAKASSFHCDASQLGFLWRTQNQGSANEAPLSLRFEPNREEAHLATRVEFSAEGAESHYLRNDVKEQAHAVKDSNISGSPLSRIYDILDVHSASSRWLEQRGYLEAFKSPNCTLDLSFGTDSAGSKVGAIVTAPDGTKRTVIACEGGASFQRLTAANGQELVKFLSSGQIVELNPERRLA